jgi:L-methionine (R)-S-oxide reductase
VQYSEIQAEVQAYMDRAWFTNLANTAAVLYDRLPNINWAGFYLLRDRELLLGPFQGKPACLRIPYGKGVCGTALERSETLVVPNVDEFPTHIVCDSRSRSEIALPLKVNGRVVGILDIDSPQLNRFGAEDQRGLEEVLRILAEKTEWPDRF